MALYKRGAIWWMRLTGPDGRERRETTRTPDKRQAQQLHDTRKAAAWRQAHLGEIAPYLAGSGASLVGGTSRAQGTQRRAEPVAPGRQDAQRPVSG